MTIKVLRVTALCYTIAAVLAVVLLMASFQTDGYSPGAPQLPTYNTAHITNED